MLFSICCCTTNYTGYLTSRNSTGGAASPFTFQSDIRHINMILKSRKSTTAASQLLRLTSFGFGEALVKAEDDLVYKVLDVSGLWTSDKHHPVMREAF